MSNHEKESDEIDILEKTSIDNDKYDRQKRIAGWDQDKVSNSTVMIIGAGATGNEVVKNLILTGIGKIILIDYDVIEKSNLNRCILFSMKINANRKYKVDVIKEIAKKINPDIKIDTYKEDINDVDKNLYKQSDVICSCLDNIEARLQANNYAYYYGIPFIDSGIDRYYGTVQAVYSGVKNAPCLQCGITGMDLDMMWQKFSCTGEELTSEDGSTIGKIATIISTTAIIGGIQSHQVLTFILGLDYFKSTGKWNPHIGIPLIGKQLNYNGLTNKFEIIKKIKNENCWVCSHVKE
ncbi:MAG: ThiF family adenylyltransferase [Promethearchaeota archaeon]|nr:MAG: ThiF family adenylyltransferase [Candidatus Lokiarchaeota archaeon]